MQQSPFPIRGVIEGFYGPFYTFPERNDLIRFLGEHGYNLYIYGPKNDRQHRHHWWEAYPPEIMDQFAHTVAIAAEAGVRFCYAIAPLNYDPLHDWPKLTRKLHAMFERGVRAFGVLVDDLICAAHHDPFCKICQRPATPHIDLCNRLHAWLRSLDPACTLSMCPIDYHGSAPFSAYLHELGAGLHREIDVFYTGPDVCAPALTAADARAFADVIGRAPLIWDNYPVNDLAMRSEMHIGPIRDRAADLPAAVRGVVINPMLQPEASKIPLLTWAAYFADPHGYDPWAAWGRALRTIGGDANYAALRHFAENSLHACLHLPEQPPLECLIDAALSALCRGEAFLCSGALQALSHYLDTLDDACYVLKSRMENLRLRHELLPWIEALDEWVWVGKRAIVLLQTIDSGQPHAHVVRGLERALREVQQHSKRTSGTALQSLANAVLDQIAARDGQRQGSMLVQPRLAA